MSAPHISLSSLPFIVPKIFIVGGNLTKLCIKGHFDKVVK